MATGRVPTTANSPLTAKGDLFGYSTTQARVPVGADGETIVADSSTATGLRWQSLTGRNFALNSDFTIWQRGTSITPSSNGGAYCADRWFVTRGSNTSVTVSQQTAGNLSTTPNQAFRYYARVQRTASSTTTSNVDLGQMFETSQVTLLAGQTVTFSGYIRKGANFSATSDALSMQIIEGTGTDQKQMDGGYTGSNTLVSVAKTLTTSWQRFSVTGTVATTSTEITIKFSYTPTGTAGASDYFDVVGVQLELGSVPTAWNLATGTLQGELAACQRYFYRFGGLIANEYFAIGTSVSATTAIGYASPKVSLRGTPTLTFTTASNYRVIEGTSQTTATSVNAEELSANNISFAFNASGFTIGRANRMNANNTTNGYIDISAEL